MYSFSIVVISYHNFSLLKQYTFVILQFSRSPTWVSLGLNQDVWRVAFLSGVSGENPFPLLASRGYVHFLARGPFPPSSKSATSQPSDLLDFSLAVQHVGS